MIAVIGATGNTGRAVVKELQALGQEPLSVVRNADKAREVLGADAKTAIADLADKGSLEKALQGVTTVFIVTGHNPQMVEQQSNVLEAAEKAGAKYFVRVSAGRAVAQPDAPTVVGRGHHAFDAKQQASKLGTVILRPGLFMQNTFGQAALIKGENKIVVAAPKDAPIAFIDVRDTGAVGARIAADPAPHVGKTYEFTGKVTNYGEFTEEFSRVLGRPITYVGITPEQFEATLKSRNTPEWLLEHMLFVARTTASGGFGNENTQPIRDIVGRDPITTRKFVEDHKAMFS